MYSHAMDEVYGGDLTIMAGAIVALIRRKYPKIYSNRIHAIKHIKKASFDKLLFKDQARACVLDLHAITERGI